MEWRWINENITYDGSQLHPLFSYLNYSLLGDSILGWIGPCKVAREHMVDGEDYINQDRIEGGEMVHFIVEKFDITLFAGVVLQRLLACLVHEWLLENAGSRAQGMNRVGDDLYYNKQKLSISIASQSTISTMIHFAVNVTTAGTPVATIGLSDFGVDPITFAKQVMQRFSDEVKDITRATRKVRPLN